MKKVELSKSEKITTKDLTLKMHIGFSVTDTGFTKGYLITINPDDGGVKTIGIFIDKGSDSCNKRLGTKLHETPFDALENHESSLHVSEVFVFDTRLELYNWLIS